LKKYINHFTVLVNRSAQTMLFTIDFDEDFIDVENIAEASVSSIQAAGINRSELDTKPD